MNTRIGRGRSEFDRGLGFFDAVYAFAITLLVTNIDAPNAAAWHSLADLLSGDLGSQLLGFVISFAVIAIFWKANTELVGRMNGMDGTLIAINLVTAGFIVFIPFTTQGISDPATNDLPLPVALYALNVSAAISSQWAMFEVARVRGFVDNDVPRSARWAGRIDVVAKVAVFTISIALAYLVGPNWAMLFWLVLLVVGPVTGRLQARIEAQAAEGSPPSSGDLA